MLELKIALFVTSFFPLWISIFFINLWSITIFVLPKLKNKPLLEIIIWGNFKKLFFQKWLEIIFSLVILLLFIWSAVFLYNFIKKNSKTNNNSKGQIKKVIRAFNLSSDFLLAYILPMIAFDFGNLKDVVLFTTIFLTLAFLCIRNENIYTNLFLEFLGYQMFYVDLKEDINDENSIIRENILFLSKEDLRLRLNGEVTYYQITDFIYIDFNQGELIYD